MTTWRFAANHSHLYPGARLRAIDAPSPESPVPGEHALIEFADGSVTSATVVAGRGALRLAVDAYRTARGTDIPSKRWELAHDAADKQAWAVLPARP